MKQLLISLHKKLKKEYPSHHYLHSRVFTLFWQLVAELHCEYIFDK